MQKELKLNKINILGIVVLVVLLVLVRLYQDTLFYDPLVAFFKSDSKTIPGYDSFRLFGGLAFRYFLNTAFSLGIIYLVFKDVAILKLSALLYLIFFVVLIAAFFLVITSADANLLFLFYIRRFLIQPLFLILFIPAFYYQKKV